MRHTRSAPRSTRRTAARRVGATLAAAALTVTLAAGCDEDDAQTSGEGETNQEAGEPTGEPTDDRGGQTASEESPEADAARGTKVNARTFTQRIVDGFDSADTARLKLRLHRGGMDTIARGQVDYSAEDPAMALTMSSPAFGNNSIKGRVVDGTMYVSLPFLSSSRGLFFKVDLDDPDNPLAGLLGGFTSFDPRATLQMFGQGTKEVRDVGKEKIDGRATRHYLVTADTASIQSSLSSGGVTLPEELTYHVWLDDQDRLAKMEADLGEQGAVVMVMSDWGEPVQIAAPPADRVQELPSDLVSPTP